MGFDFIHTTMFTLFSVLPTQNFEISTLNLSRKIKHHLNRCNFFFTDDLKETNVNGHRFHIVMRSIKLNKVDIKELKKELLKNGVNFFLEENPIDMNISINIFYFRKYDK